jgi:LPXTG-motif cell wall-anchored protein
MAAAALGALCILPMTAAGAQVGVEPATDCTYSVSGGPGTYTIAGVAPADATVTLYFTPDGGTQTPQPPDQQGPNFSFTFTVPANVGGSISVGYVRTIDGNAYTAVCGTVAGEVAVRVEAANASRGPSAAALAFTGSSDTPSYVLIGIAAVVVGAVLVVAARRRKQVS